MGFYNKFLSIIIDPVPWLVMAMTVAMFWLATGEDPFMYSALFFILGSAEMAYITDKKFPVHQYVDIQVFDDGMWNSMLVVQSKYRFYETNCAVDYGDIIQTLETLVSSMYLADVLRKIHEKHEIRFIIYLGNERFKK